MRNVMNATSERQARRMRADQEELAHRIARAMPRDGTVEPQPGLHFRRCSRPTERLHGFYEPAFCVIAQGSKELVLGGDRFRYDPAHYMISTVELPMIGQVIDASPERPFLGFRLVLDPSIVTSVMVESGVVQPSGDGSGVKSVDVSPLDAKAHLVGEAIATQAPGCAPVRSTGSQVSASGASRRLPASVPANTTRGR